MTPRHEIRYTVLPDGRHIAECVVCIEFSAPTWCKPNAQAWAKGHVREGA